MREDDNEEEMKKWREEEEPWFSLTRLSYVANRIMCRINPNKMLHILFSLIGFQNDSIQGGNYSGRSTRFDVVFRSTYGNLLYPFSIIYKIIQIKLFLSQFLWFKGKQY